MWSLESGQRLLTLRCHTDGVTCLQFNDYSIVSGSYDKTVKLWDFTPSHEFLTPGWTDSFFQQRIQLVKDILFTKILQLTLNHSWNCVLESCHFEWWQFAVREEDKISGHLPFIFLCLQPLESEINLLLCVSLLKIYNAIFYGQTLNKQFLE